MSKEIIVSKNKKLSKESKELLDELGRISLNAADIIPNVYSSLKRDGFESFEARKMIEERIEISQRRLRELLPPEVKKPRMVRELPRKSAQLASDTTPNITSELRRKSPQLTSDTTPQIPAPKQEIQDAQVIRRYVMTRAELVTAKGSMQGWNNITITCDDKKILKIE